jgi:membrane fusion protein (multidrug efflux system)
MFLNIIVKSVRAGLWIALGLASGLAARAQPPGQMPPTPVEVATVRAAPASLTAAAVGSLLADESVTLRPEVAGRANTIHFAEGQRVARGDVLVTLDQEEARALLAQNAAEARMARLNHDRVRDLKQKRISSDQDYDEAVARLAEAEASVEVQRVKLEKTVLRAPFAGTIGIRRMSPGAYLEAGQELVTLVSDDPIKVEFRLPERHAGAVHPGQPVAVRVDALPGEAFTGDIYAVEPGLDPATRTMLLRARIPNPSGRLRPGMFARVEVVLAEQPLALWVPEQALVPQGERQFVYRVEDARVKMVEVRVGQRRDGQVEITSGLGAGEVVVTAGQTKIRDGSGVQPLPAQAQAQGPQT